MLQSLVMDTYTYYPGDPHFKKTKYLVPPAHPSFPGNAWYRDLEERIAHFSFWQIYMLHSLAF